MDKKDIVIIVLVGALAIALSSGFGIVRSGNSCPMAAGVYGFSGYFFTGLIVLFIIVAIIIYFSLNKPGNREENLRKKK
ncbi:MAG: hypothetical protein AABX11_03155 [Nanoarchaeota archaeon]